MGLRVAFIGATGTGKAVLAERARSLIIDSGLARRDDIVVVPSVFRHLAHVIGIERGPDADEWDEVLAAAQRRIWIAQSKHPVLISVGSAFQEAAYLGVRLARLDIEFRRLSGFVPAIEVPNDGQRLSPVVAEKAARLELMRAAFMTLAHFALDEYHNVWDVLYFCRVGDRVAEDDGFRTFEPEPRTVDEQLHALIRMGGVDMPKVIDLSWEDAMQRLEDEVERWKPIMVTRS